METKLKPEEIIELMRALGFHRIPSRNRWKMKISDTIVVTDAQLRDANENGPLADFLMKYLDESFKSLSTLARRKQILSAFFK